MSGFAAKALTLGVSAVAFIALSTGQALATHIACGDVITEDTTLDSNVVCNEYDPRDGVTIGADNITLDLNGHTISASCNELQTAVVNQGHDGVTIINGRTFGGGAVVVLVGASNNRIVNLEGFSCAQGPGVYLVRSSHNEIERTLVGTYRGTGTLLTESDHNRLENASGPVSVQNSHHNVILGSGGVSLYASHHNRIHGCVGISLRSSNKNSVEKNLTIDGYAGI
jgi:hypothetical protein